MPVRTAKLTKRTVDAATPEVERFIVWDVELKGFALRVAPTGTKTYLVRYRPKSATGAAPKRFVVIGRHGPLTPDEARVRARALLGAVAGGQDPSKAAATKAADLQVQELVRRFIDEHVRAKRKSRTAEDYNSILTNYIIPAFSRKMASLVTTSDMARLHLSMRDRPYQANRLLATVGSMYGFAIKQGLVPQGTANPTIGVERFREQSRERYLTIDELGRLGIALKLGETTGLPWREDPHFPKSKHLALEANRHLSLAPGAILAIRLLILTGARLREILHLEWRHVDLERGLILLPDSKTGRKTLVLSEPVVELLCNADRDGPYVIAGADPSRPRSDLKRPWQAVQRHAGLEGVRLHDLRHTFASIGVGASLGLPIVGKLLGHTQAATTARYAHVDADPLRRATNLIGTHLSQAMLGTPRSN